MLSHNNVSFSPNPRVEYVTLRTRLSPEECFRRLQPLTLPWFSIMLIIPWAFSKLPVMGWVWPTGFALRKITVDVRNQLNGLQPEAKADFVVVPGGGTQMRVRLGPRRWIMVFGWIALAYILLFTEGLTFLCRSTGNPRCQEPSAFLWPLLLPAFILVMSFWPWRQTNIEKTFLINFLKQMLEAEEIPEYAHTAERR